MQLKDKKFLELAIDMAQKSLDEGAFPAGAVIVKGNNIIAKAISAKYPQIIFHSESNALDTAMKTLDAQLSDCVLYASMEPCLMCLSRAYWAGIRKIVFAVKKESTKHTNYESNLNNFDLLEKFNEKIELVQIEELEEKALKIVEEWGKNNP